MKWSLRLGRFLGIDVFLHITFILFVVLVWYLNRQSGFGTVLFMITMFTCVVLHEYGHALTARRFGIATRDITLLPIGGVARLERMPSEPWQELLVAIAGPAVNVVIAAVLWGVCILAGVNPLHKIDRLVSGEAHFITTLMWWNLAMVAFNMLPAFPMDGGRVLRALLAMKLPYVKATRVAATVGKGMALLFAYYAIFHQANPILILIAFFVWSGASDESAAAEERHLLSGIRVRDAMLSNFHRLGPDTEVRTVAQLILEGWQTDFPVVFDDAVVGVITRQDVIAGLARGPQLPVSGSMRRDIPSCGASDPLQLAIERMRENNLPLLPVIDGTRLVGLVTPENSLEFILFRRAIAERLS